VRRNLGLEDFASQEQDALGFVESMGFIMDQVNFRGLSQSAQEELLRSVPVFQKDPRIAIRALSPKADAEASPQEKLGRLLAAF
jgi:hypothetical protein